jgi:serine/threonine protein kinase
VRYRDDESLIYVGSTIQPLYKRWNDHKTRSQCETSKEYNKLLIRETKIYQYLKNIPGIPQLLWCGINDPYYYLVLPLYNGSLQNVKIDTTEKLYELGNEILSIIKNIHHHNIIHRDIKPENIMFNHLGKITIIDFGLCKIYKENTNHIPFKKINNIIGTINYISINVHNLHEPCRADDIESVIYVLLYIYNPMYLEWSNDENLIDIKNKKENIIFNNKIPIELIDFLIYTRSLLFTGKPRYNIV